MKTLQLTNLWGEPVTVKVSEAKHPQAVRKGYAALPGTGPKDEKCKTCAHDRLCGIGHAKQFHKCILMKSVWTGGYGTDILANSPACRMWEKITEAAT